LKAALHEHATIAIIGPQGKTSCASDKSCSLSKDLRVPNRGRHMCGLIDDLFSLAALIVYPSGLYIDTMRLVGEVLAQQNQGGGRSFQTCASKLPVCEDDPALVKQMWINLASNAIRYSRERTPPVVDVGCGQKNGSLVYPLRDNGVGFNMKHAQKLAGNFQRSHRRGCRVRAHAGPGCGATSYFTLKETKNYDRQRN
jgi:light-regulated signal transduction histidine kinase (bacteriophytochrome)